MALKEEQQKRDQKEVMKQRPMSKEELQEALIHNFISLQKALTNMTVKFDELSTNISKLLQLFEISAKSFAEKYSSIEASKDSSGEFDKEFIKKLDTLLDQNKIISKGIMLIEERVREKSIPERPREMYPQQAIRPQNDPRFDTGGQRPAQPRY